MTPLVDGFGRTHTYVRIAVTDRCNCRCMYCMPPGGIAPRPKGDLLTFDEIARVASICAGMGVTKIRLTGGEPLVRRDLPVLVRLLRGIPGIETVSMTTNGVLLAENARVLRDAGLASVNVSLDTLRPERFERITGRPGPDGVVAGIDAALDAGLDPVKVNMVVMGGVNDDELPDFVEFARHRPVEVRFIEFMPFRENGWAPAGMVPQAVMQERLARRYRLQPMNGGPGGKVRGFAVEGAAGSIGVIAPMSDHFCGACDRLRLTADGAVKPCLFDGGEVRLRDALRTGAGDDTVAAMIRSAVLAKPAGHPPAMALAAAGNRSMIDIGG